MINNYVQNISNNKLRIKKPEIASEAYCNCREGKRVSAFRNGKPKRFVDYYEVKIVSDFINGKPRQLVDYGNRNWIPIGSSFEGYCNCGGGGEIGYNKMLYKGVDDSGTVWIDQGPTLWPGSSTILGEDPGISWI